MGHVARLILFALCGALPAWAWACIDQSTYDANNGTVGTQSTVGTWRVSELNGLATTGSPPYYCPGTYSESLACGRSAAQAQYGANCTTVDWGAPVLSSGRIRNDGTCRKADGTVYTTARVWLSFVSSSWPSGYDNTVCPTIPCSTLANVKTLGSAVDVPDNFEPKDSICAKSGTIGGVSQPIGGSNGCAAFKRANQGYKRLGPTGARDWLVQYQFTGLDCDAEPEQTETPVDDSDAEKCHTGPGGLTWCESRDAAPNCGFFNDKYVCLESLGTDKCFTQTDGKRLCVETAPAPPTPDNGTPGVKATPDDQMSVCTGSGACTQYNYYNSTTNSTSSRGTGSGGNTDGSGTVGPGGTPAGSGDGTEEGDSAAGGGDACDAPPTCSGDPIQCTLLKQQWRTRCDTPKSDAELVGAMGFTAAEKGEEAGPHDGVVDLAASEFDTNGFISGGSCPVAPNVTVMGETIDMSKLWDGACQMAALFAPIVQAVGFLMAAFVLFRTNWS